MFGHGWSKISNYATYQEQFPDPLGFGGEMSLGLAIFAEFFCGLAVVLGLFTRVAVIPLIVTMLTAVLIVHSDDPFAQKELALMYLIPFVTLLITGPGKYSFDSIVSRKFDNPTAKI
ncbi:DoxX family membrane protein [candidate division GN15 bacterium]|nr:DoxX family membrane protein [candidate division GN15 bacterium]